MSRNKLPHKQIKLACVIPILLLGLASYPLRSQAQLAESSSNTVANTENLADQKFPDNGAPTGRREGGASRSGCPDLKTPITALVPGEKTNKTSFLASTVAEYPTFWVYVPELPAFIHSGEFVLQDEVGNDVFRKLIALPGKQGAIALRLPSNPKYALKQNSKYHWYFQVYCREPQNKQNQSEYFYVDAWVQRMPLTPKVQQQLNTAKSREYTVYTANHIWYDAITNLAELRRTNPSSRVFNEDWTKLFKAAGLAELSQAPIVY